MPRSTVLTLNALREGNQTAPHNKGPSVGHHWLLSRQQINTSLMDGFWQSPSKQWLRAVRASGPLFRYSWKDLIVLHWLNRSDTPTSWGEMYKIHSLDQFTTTQNCSDPHTFYCIIIAGLHTHKLYRYTCKDPSIHISPNLAAPLEISPYLIQSAWHFVTRLEELV